MPPEKIGRYLIESNLGQGGMGTVYLALDPLIKRQVAVKVLPQQFNHDPAFRERFRREAQIIASLEHPSIVPLHDFGEHENQPFIVMRYMPGGTLNGRLQRGSLSMSRILDILERIAPGLDKAHVHGIVHRDLKPSNILFDADDEAYLADFGIAKVQEATAALTGSAIIGTPAYMSPEQAQGEKDIDGRSDVYSMGIILYQMLTGRAPYVADTPMKLVVMHIMEPVPTILSVKPDLPEKIEPLIARALAKDPKDRFYTVGDMTQTLRHIATEARRQSGSSIQTGPFTPAEEEAPRVTNTVDLLAETTVEPKPATAPPSQPQVPTSRPPAVREAGPVTGTQPPKPRRFAPWIWLAGLGGVGAVALILAVAAAGIYWFFIRDPATPPPPPVPPTATVEIVQVDPTLTPAAAPTTQPAGTDPAFYGPASGSLFHEADGFVSADSTGLNVQNFVVEATFVNPYATSQGEWDLVFIFRQTELDVEFRGVIDSTGYWSLTGWFGGTQTTIMDGLVDNLDLLEGGGNLVRLVVYNNLGLLYVNNVLISHLDLSTRIYSGDIQIATDLILEYETSGQVTNYQDFTIQPLDPITGPWEGNLVHDEDGFLSEDITELDIRNFIVESTVFNPYALSAGNWDVGYLFRHTGSNDQFRLFIDSTGYWSLADWSGDDSVVVNDGMLFDLDTSSGGANQLQLIAVDALGFLFVNDVFISPLDLSRRPFSGDLSLAIGHNYEIAGETTPYTNFAVLPLP